MSASVHAGIPPRSRPPLGADTPQEQTPPWSRHPPPEQTPPRSRHIPPEQTPPLRKQTPAYGQRAAGTHPTGMHSCLIFFLGFVFFYVPRHQFSFVLNSKNVKNVCRKFVSVTWHLKEHGSKSTNAHFGQETKDIPEFNPSLGYSMGYTQWWKRLARSLRYVPFMCEQKRANQPTNSLGILSTSIITLRTDTIFVNKAYTLL